MKYIFYPFFCSILILASCLKKTERALDSFTIKGKITDCKTGQPIEGVRIHLIVGNSGSLFGSSEDGGETYSDNQGNYSIIPYRLGLSGAEGVNMTLEKDQYFSTHLDFNTIPLRLSGAKDTLLDIGVGRAGYLKLILNNDFPFDDQDLLVLFINSIGVCGGGNGVYLNSIPSDWQSNGFDDKELKGIIHGGHITYMVKGDDTAVVRYNTTRNWVNSADSTIRTYCRTADTTVIQLRY